MTYKRNSYRKFVATSATAALVATAVSPAAAVSVADFEDVASKYTKAVDYLVTNEISIGSTETTFGTNDKIIRADAAIWIAKALGLDTESAPDSGFTDVPERAIGAVNAIKEAGITNGKSETRFGASDTLTRGEMAVWLKEAYELTGEAELEFTDVNSNYAAAVEALVANEITVGTSDTTFGTTNDIKRGDLAIFLHKAYKLGVVLESGISGVVLDGEKPVVGATVTIDGKTATTDAEGKYEILDVEPGTYEVTVEAEGYETVITGSDVEVLEDEVTELEALDLASFKINLLAIGNPDGTDSIILEFAENIEAIGSLDLAGTDFLIYDDLGNELTAGIDYEVVDATPGDAELEIELINNYDNYVGELEVSTLESVTYISENAMFSPVVIEFNGYVTAFFSAPNESANAAQSVDVALDGVALSELEAITVDLLKDEEVIATNTADKLMENYGELTGFTSPFYTEEFTPGTGANPADDNWTFGVYDDSITPDAVQVTITDKEGNVYTFVSTDITAE